MRCGNAGRSWAGCTTNPPRRRLLRTWLIKKQLSLIMHMWVRWRSYTLRADAMPDDAVLNYAVSSSALAFAEGATAVEPWYVVRVRTKYERLIARHLTQQEINCFLPVYRSVRRWKDRRKELEMALFPGYVFVKVNAGGRLGVLRAPGVLGFVTFQGRPAPVPGSEIKALESTMSAGLAPQPHPYLRQGRKVRVKSGPLLDTEGVLIRRRDGFRLVLSINLISRAVMLEIDEADVEPL
jgi:transcription antitermination factor NusG